MLTVVVKDKVHRLIRVILPFLKSRAGVLSISSAAILAVLYSLVQKFNRPPSQLRHLPYVDRFTFLKYGFKDIPYDQYGKEKLLPLLKAGTNGIYLRCTVEGWSVRLANPIAIKQFTLKQEYTFPKATDNGGVEGSLIKKFLGGPNIVFLSGADWKRHRKIANLAFQRSMPIKLFGRLTKKMFESMEDLGYDNVDVNDLFQRFTLDAIGIGGFGFDFNALGDKDSQWVKNYESIMQGMASPFFIAFPAFDTTYRHWFKKRLEVHNSLDMFLDNIDKMIEQKRRNVYENAETSSSDEEKDLLTLMIESETKGAGERMSDEELRSNLCIFFLAGHDTTANTLAAILYELAKHPEIQERARQEAIRILGDGPEDIVPTFDQLKELSYINMIIKETLRRHPPAYATTDRVTQEDLMLGGMHIPKGSGLAIDIYLLHHNPDVWADPFEFKPERFAPGGEAEHQKGIAWAPFSNGGRQCVGMNFSLTEQRVLIPMLLKKFTWTLPNDSPHKEELLKRGIAWGLVTFSDKVKINFKKRHS